MLLGEREHVWDTHRTTWWTLTQGEIEFRTITYQYTQALAQSTVANPGPLVEFARQLAANLGINLTAEQGQQILSGTLALCSGDFDDAIQDAIDQIQAH